MVRLRASALYVDQVASLVTNTGTTYASSDLVFGVTEGDEAEDISANYQADISDEEDEETQS